MKKLEAPYHRRPLIAYLSRYYRTDNRKIRKEEGRCNSGRCHAEQRCCRIRIHTTGRRRGRNLCPPGARPMLPVLHISDSEMVGVLACDLKSWSRLQENLLLTSIAPYRGYATWPSCTFLLGAILSLYSASTRQRPHEGTSMQRESFEVKWHGLKSSG